MWPRLGLVGAAAMLAGLTWDALLHSHDPSLALHEGIFTLRNPGHLLLGFGLGATVVSQVGGLSLRFRSRWMRGTLVVITGVIVSLSAAAIAQAAQSAASSGIRHHSGATDSATKGQILAASRLLADTRTGIARYQDSSAAIADGYVPMSPQTGMVVHYISPTNLRAGRVLDTRHPERLMYLNGPRGLVLAGAMFVMPAPGLRGPDVGGPLTHWHHHDGFCFSANGTLVGTVSYGLPCPTGSITRSTPEMLHVWIVDNPDGPFADDIAPAAIVRVLARV